MSRRLVIYKKEDYQNRDLVWCTLGLGDEIYSYEYLMSLSEEQRRQILDLYEGDAVLIASGDFFKYFRELYHVGMRSEGFGDITQCKMKRIAAERNIVIKCVTPGEFPSKEDVAEFMSLDFTRFMDISGFKHKNIQTLEGAHKFLDWIDSLPLDEKLGFDYEGSGMALDKWFELSGLSIVNLQYGGFISLTDIRHQLGGAEHPEYKALLKRIGNILVQRQLNIYTYNMGYEYAVSFRMLGVDLYNLNDSSVFNVLDGVHYKKFSLKFTAQRMLPVPVWDADFDKISDLIDSMLYTEIGKTKAEKQRIFKVDKNTYKSTPEWQELSRRYPEDIDEMGRLLEEYWNPFMCVSSRILAKYCCLDSYITLLLYEARKNVYTDQAIQVFMDNIRLACHLHSTGVPKWESYRKEYEDYCLDMMVWGITYDSACRCMIKMRKHQAMMGNISKYHPVCQILLKKNKFFNGDPLLITKDLLASNIDTLDSTDTGLDEGGLYLQYGDDFAEKFIDIVKESMIEVKMKTKIDETIVRKKKILSIISEKLVPLIGLDKFKLTKKHLELEKYLFYERAWKEICKIYDKQIKDINSIPKEIYAFGQKYDRLGFYDFMSKTYFPSSSPIQNDEMCLEIARLFPGETAFIAALGDSMQQLPDNENYYKVRGITNLEDAYKHFQVEFSKAWNGDENTDYPTKMYELSYQYYQDIVNPKTTNLCDQNKDVWADFKGYETQEKLFKDISNNYLEFRQKFEPSDLDKGFGFIQKFQLNYLLQRKYQKIYSTYICGMFQKEICVIEDPKTHVMLREADPGEPGAVVKLKIPFACMEKSSKRWSSPFHTIVSKSDIKSTLSSYGYGSGYGAEAFGGQNTGHLLSYFDIDKLVSRIREDVIKQAAKYRKALTSNVEGNQ